MFPDAQTPANTHTPAVAEPRSHGEATAMRRAGLVAPDTNDYRELKKRVTPEGAVVKRRDISPGEQVLHSIFGAPRRE